jgi:mannose PTS system EIIA component
MRDFRIVVAAHGALARALVASAEMICGPLDDVHIVDLVPEDSPESFSERLMAAVGSPANGVLILTDLVGGTPHNVALAATHHLSGAVIVSGVNLAVLLEAATTTSALDGDFLEHLVSSGREALSRASELLAARKP